MATAISCIVSPADEGFWLGAQEVIATRMSSAEDLQSFGEEQLGEITAILVMSSFSPVASLISIWRRNHNALLVCLGIGIFVGMSFGAIPVLNIIVVIVVASKKSIKEYVAP